MKVTMKGKYRTREGDIVEILRDNVKNEDFPIVGIITFPDGLQEQNRWQADGKYNGYFDEHPLDLISIPYEGWIVVDLEGTPVAKFGGAIWESEMFAQRWLRWGLERGGNYILARVTGEDKDDDR